MVNLIYAVKTTAKGKLTSKSGVFVRYSDVNLHVGSRFFGLRLVFSACRPDL